MGFLILLSCIRLSKRQIIWKKTECLSLQTFTDYNSLWNKVKNSIFSSLSFLVSIHFLFCFEAAFSFANFKLWGDIFEVLLEFNHCFIVCSIGQHQTFRLKAVGKNAEASKMASTWTYCQILNFFLSVSLFEKYFSSGDRKYFCWCEIYLLP